MEDLSRDSSLVWLQSWYASQCDGDWEHQYGVKIETLDNPGWSVVINLTHTNMHGHKFDPISLHLSGSDWMNCSVKEDSFCGHGDPTKLEAICEQFRRWVTSSPKSPTT